MTVPPHKVDIHPLSIVLANPSSSLPLPSTRPSRHSSFQLFAVSIPSLNDDVLCALWRTSLATQRPLPLSQNSRLPRCCPPRAPRHLAVFSLSTHVFFPARYSYPLFSRSRHTLHCLSLSRSRYPLATSLTVPHHFLPFFASQYSTTSYPL